MRTPIRHGEVLLLPVESTPAGASERVRRCVVGHGESGHHHVLDGDREFATIVSASGTLYVHLDAPTTLRHQKDHDRHRDLEVPAGAWRVVRRTGFDVSPTVDTHTRVRYVRA